jgi:hypothetical protein
LNLEEECEMAKKPEPPPSIKVDLGVTDKRGASPKSGKIIKPPPPAPPPPRKK